MNPIYLTAHLTFSEVPEIILWLVVGGAMQYAISHIRQLRAARIRK